MKGLGKKKGLFAKVEFFREIEKKKNTFANRLMDFVP
jgi:hypothetical protein